ncbi:MAG: isoprenyl transferase [Phycisphaerales bacterium JB059]
MTSEGTPSTIDRASEGGRGLSSDPRALAVIERMRRRTPEADPLAVLPDVHPERIPRHVAIIMDGNGRWAEQRGFPRVFGHRNGAISVRDVVTEAGRLGIEALTLYSFSAENWKRPKDEIDALMDLCVTYCDGEREKLAEKNVHVRVIGRTHELPTEAREAIERLEATTASCTGPTLCLAINYGSRNEIVDAVRSIGQRIARGEISPDEIDASMIDASLYTAGLPDPDLMIRTGGEMRISNYLLWQLSYAELYVSDLLWPDFDAAALREAVRAFASRRRRFGGLDADAT